MISFKIMENCVVLNVCLIHFTSVELLRTATKRIYDQNKTLDWKYYFCLEIWTFGWIACEKWCNHIRFRFKMFSVFNSKSSFFGLFLSFPFWWEDRLNLAGQLIFLIVSCNSLLLNFEAGCNWCLRTTEKTNDLDQIRISDWP